MDKVSWVNVSQTSLTTECKVEIQKVLRIDLHVVGFCGQKNTVRVSWSLRGYYCHSYLEYLSMSLWTEELIRKKLRTQIGDGANMVLNVNGYSSRSADCKPTRNSPLTVIMWLAIVNPISLWRPMDLFQKSTRNQHRLMKGLQQWTLERC